MEAVKYYHGGFGGLRVGQHVLPPEKTGAPSTASYGAGAVCRRDRVYVTTNMEAAFICACLHTDIRGRVYEVEPIGAVVPDPDGVGNHSFECEKAKIVRVFKVGGKLIKTVRKQARAAA
ncbi:NAD(+)--rifampin ADP-ribosyltransferase [Phyllobacterium chamaecytisi]|uniref:NAD(+)--rifampin ADP-ribosyltransferase n=1 Tax=Phyllobacterium chamaecytisi TaxID=2876082 RepID=UPI001CC91B1C|nr:NAD(+)--rifampin ADP-ribosyltransferase [Phyllobacterium sp. KW56]MBZ9600690.1 NAD(+)--rifampin ADP-ribosyltransferase [Phyllobacterium sp. KW56]